MTSYILKLLFILLFFSNTYANNIDSYDISNSSNSMKIAYKNFGKLDSFLFKKNQNKQYEILYFFSYSCSACYKFHSVENGFKTLISKRDDIEFREIPVKFYDHWLYTSKIFFIANALNLNNINTNIYKRIHEDKKFIISDEDILKYFYEEHELDEIQVSNYLNNPILLNATDQAMALADKFNIPSTPFFLVIDKNFNVYEVSHKYSNTDLGVIATLNYLINPEFKKQIDLGENNE